MKNLKVSQVTVVEFLQNADPSKKPICRIEGIVGFISPKDTEFPRVGEVWIVSIVEVKEKHCVVLPVELTMTIDQVEKMKLEKLAAFATNTPKKKQPVKKSYQYMSKKELLSCSM